MMNFTTLSIIMALQILVCAEPVAERDQKTREELYHRLAARVFATYYDIRNSDLPKSEQERWVHLGANAAFQYWITTRKGGIRESKEVEGAIAFFYEDALESRMTTGFSDPLYRMNVEDADNIGVHGFPHISQEQYKEYVGEFKAFLSDVLKVRRLRQHETKKRLKRQEE